MWVERLIAPEMQMRALALAGERRREHRVAACAQQCGDTRVAPAAAPCAVDEDEGGGFDHRQLFMPA